MGGYMGLLLGASVLTFIEILDVFLHHFATRNLQEQRDQPPEYDDNDTEFHLEARKLSEVGFDGPIFSVQRVGLPREHYEEKTYF